MKRILDETESNAIIIKHDNYLYRNQPKYSYWCEIGFVELELILCLDHIGIDFYIYNKVFKYIFGLLLKNIFSYTLEDYGIKHLQYGGSPTTYKISPKYLLCSECNSFGLQRLMPDALYYPLTTCKEDLKIDIGIIELELLLCIKHVGITFDFTDVISKYMFAFFLRSICGHSSCFNRGYKFNIKCSTFCYCKYNSKKENCIYNIVLSHLILEYVFNGCSNMNLYQSIRNYYNSCLKLNNNFIADCKCERHWYAIINRIPKPQTDQ